MREEEQRKHGRKARAVALLATRKKRSRWDGKTITEGEGKETATTIKETGQEGTATTVSYPTTMTARGGQ